MNLRIRILNFLYDQLNQNKISQIRKGMCEDFEEFVMKLLAEQQEKDVATKMAAVPVQETTNEDNNK